MDSHAQVRAVKRSGANRQANSVNLMPSLPPCPTPACARYRLRTPSPRLWRKSSLERRHGTPFELRSVLLYLGAKFRAQSPCELFYCVFQASH